jgi:two-component system, OmpR family, alkaline phosphatase synthesis response regulator PhoP
MENVLVVEDEANILKLVSINLVSRGYRVREASNGTEALELLRQEVPSLMVLDIKLPDYNGWELLNKLKQEPVVNADFPVLVMTASITDAYVDLKSYPSVIDVLIKPFSSVKLISSVERAITSRH